MKESSTLIAHRPGTINQAGLIVGPKQPFVYWYNSVDDGGPEAARRLSPFVVRRTLAKQSCLVTFCSSRTSAFHP